jgi:uncharacterized cupin superfamily protein
MTLTTGNVLVIEPGVAGTWEVIEAMSKHFVTRYVSA